MVDVRVDLAVGDTVEDGAVEHNVMAGEGFGVEVTKGFGILFVRSGIRSVWFPEDCAWGGDVVVCQSFS